MSSARVLACFPWQMPRFIRFPSDPGLPGHLGGLMEIIGRPIESVALGDGVTLWHRPGALQPGPDAALNRRVPMDPRLPDGYEQAEPAWLAAVMGLAVHLEVYEAFILVRGDAEAGLEDMTDEDIKRWTRWFEVDERVRLGE